MNGVQHKNDIIMSFYRQPAITGFYREQRTATQAVTHDAGPGAGQKDRQHPGTYTANAGGVEVRGGLSAVSVWRRRYLQGDKKIKIDIDCDDDLEALINPTLLEQAVLNLVDNAIKYSPAESTIQISARRAEKEVIIAVKDSGCGIEKSHLSRIFERFYVVDKARTRKLGGTGLGLAIVKHIVNLHGGSVSVESSPGQGSTFTIHLPIR